LSSWAIPLERRCIGPTADDNRLNRPHGRDPGKRLQQNIDALELAQLADEQEIGGVCIGPVRGEIAWLQRIGDDPLRHAPGAHALVVNAADEVAFEDHPVGVAGEELLDRRVDKALWRGEGVMQAAAVRGVERRGVAAFEA
jgi:hypothetical protein